jgi:hypothetical protein
VCLYVCDQETPKREARPSLRVRSCGNATDLLLNPPLPSNHTTVVRYFVIIVFYNTGVVLYSGTFILHSSNFICLAAQY